MDLRNGKKLSIKSFAGRALVAIVNMLLFIDDFFRVRAGRRSFLDGGTLVSFPIATFDRFDILVDRTIPSILGQTHQNLEIIVVIDGSHPGLTTRLSEIHDPRVRVKHLKNRTNYPKSTIDRWMVAGWRPRNIGARMARGDWIYWISDDDVLLPTAVEDLLRLARSSEFESVSGAYLRGDREQELMLPSVGIDAVGVAVTGPPAWLTRIYVGRMKWNRHSWLKQWDRPSDYDLLKRMLRVGVRFGHTNSVVATQPAVAGTKLAGLKGALQANEGLDQ